MDKYAALTPEILNILCDRGTERPFTGEYSQLSHHGTYLCRGCGLALFRTDHQFNASCGWPSFDDEISGTIVRQPDADGQRMEIICARCKGHLGHVFLHEGFTQKNLRHCVNATAIEFVDSRSVVDCEEGIFAAGCFWGVEHLFLSLAGVLKTEVGYSGGHTGYPNYEQVCQQNTGHVEAIRVLFDPTIISYVKLLEYFFEIHDPTQSDGQGPDVGPQYRSVIFYFNAQQKAQALAVQARLALDPKEVSTELRPATTFWPAEAYHQKYYKKTGGLPYCHRWIKKF